MKAIRGAAAAALGLLAALAMVEAALRVATRGGAFAGLPLLPLDVAAPVRGITRAELDRAYLAFDPNLGWTVGASRRSADGRYRSTAAAARDDGGAPGAETTHAAWAVAFGDSFTHGDDVPGDATWEHALFARTGRPVVNFGVPGYGVDQALLRYRDIGPAWRSSVVFIGFMADNIGRHVNRYRPFLWPADRMFFVKPRFELDGDRLTLIPSPFHADDEYLAPGLEARLRAVGEHDAWYRPAWYSHSSWDSFRTARVFRTVLELRGARGPRWRELYADPRAVALTRRILLDFAAAVRQAGSAPVVLFFPDQTVCADARAGRAALAQPLLASLAHSGVEVVDLTAVVTAAAGHGTPETNFRPHYSPELNAAVGKALAEGRIGAMPQSRP